MNVQANQIPTYESVVRTGGIADVNERLRKKGLAPGANSVANALPCGMGSMVDEPGGRLKKPEWLKIPLPEKGSVDLVRGSLKKFSVRTVCEAAACPNSRECFHKGTAAFMIMGSYCTRKCNFCNVQFGRPDALDPEEPRHLAETAKELNLKHLVVTSVTRDDLPDGGAHHFAEVVRQVNALVDPAPAVELLIPDMQGDWDALQIILDAGPEVLNHNVETVPRLYSTVRPQAIYERSLELLKQVKLRAPGMVTKSGFMLGLGETEEEVFQLMDELRAVECDCLTIGQYLRPSLKHLPVVEYVHPDVFERYRLIGLEKGFKSVASGPFVRSSYMAADFYEETLAAKVKQKSASRESLNSKTVRG